MEWRVVVCPSQKFLSTPAAIVASATLQQTRQIEDPFEGPGTIFESSVFEFQHFDAGNSTSEQLPAVFQKLVGLEQLQEEDVVAYWLLCADVMVSEQVSTVGTELLDRVGADGDSYDWRGHGISCTAAV